MTDDPITNPLGLDRPDREGDEPLPPPSKLTFGQTLEKFMELAARAELERLQALRDRMVNKA